MTYGEPMKFSLPVLAAVLAAGLPLTVCAQQAGPPNGQPPEMRAQMQAARDAAKTAAFNDLSPATRTKVQAIVDQINGGQLTDLRAAAAQIDAALTPAEAKAVLGEREKMMASMRANMPPRPDGAGPNGPGPMAGGPNGPGADHPRGPGAGANDAGRFLISLGVSREKMHELRKGQMQQQPPQPKPL
jgi:hypothetical protein